MDDQDTVLLSLYCAIDDDFVWILSWEYDILIQIERTTFEYCDAFCVPIQEMKTFQHLAIASSGNRIYVIPFNDENLYYFNIDEKEFYRLDIPYEINEKSIKGKFCFAVCWNNRLALFGNNLKFVLYYDESTNQFFRDDSFLECLESAGVDVNHTVFTEFYSQVDNLVYVPVYNTSIIIIFDLESKEYTILDMGNNFKLNTIFSYKDRDETRFMLTTTDDNVVMWSPTKGIEGIKNNHLKKENDKYKFAGCVDGKSFFILERDTHIYATDDTGILKIEVGKSKQTIDYVLYGFATMIDGSLVFQERESGRLFSLDAVTCDIKELPTSISYEKISEILKHRFKMCQKVGIINEKKIFGLTSFIETIQYI